MRISDWSSDVCSSDLYTNDKKKFSASFTNDNTVCTTVQGLVLDDAAQPEIPGTADNLARAVAGGLIGLADRKSVVEGKRVSVRVDHGGSRIIKKKKT